MRKQLSILVLAVSLLVLFTNLTIAQSIPKIALAPVFPELKFESDLPIWMSESPDGTGRMFVIEQVGLIQIVDKGSDGSRAKKFLNIIDRHPHTEYEEGLLSMAFHPGFKTNGLFYIYYNQVNTNPNSLYPRRSVISEVKVSATDPNVADMQTERVLLEVQQPFANHKGGQICFGPDGYLYIGLGDGGEGFDPYNSGQNTASFLGKILRIDVNNRDVVGSGDHKRTLPYSIPADNPFINENSTQGAGRVRREIWAYGLRNPWRYSFDRQSGDLWVGDVGQDLWEEIDLIVKGGNYGWCVREGAHHFKPGPPGAQYIDPVMEYPHKPSLLPESKFPDHTIGLCVIGGYVYRGKKYPSLQGVYIYADFTLGTIWGFRYQNGVVTQSALLLDQPKNVASFAEDADGELYVVQITGAGRICSIVVP